LLLKKWGGFFLILEKWMGILDLYLVFGSSEFLPDAVDMLDSNLLE